MKSKKVISLLAAAVLAAGVMAGCGGSDNNAGGSKTDAPAASTGAKTMSFGIQNYSGGGLDPAKETNTAWNCSRYGVGECLFKFDNSMTVINTLCDSYEVNDAHDEWVLHIREGIKFTDGCDLTPEAVKKNFERLYEEGPNGSAAPQKFMSPDAELIADNDAMTLTIKTPEPVVDLTKNLAYPVMIILDVEHTEDFDHAAIGTGPYIAKEFTEEVGYTMVKNENYWNGEVPFDSITLMYMDDASAKAMAMQSEQIDLTENITNINDLKNLMDDERFTVTVANGVRTGLAHINVSEGRILSNDTLRQAVIMALDDTTMCEVTVGGLYTEGFSVLPSNLDYGYSNLKDPFAYNKDAAVKLLDDAGIVDTDNDGIRELDGKPVELHYVTYANRCLGDFAEAIQQQLGEIGIKVNLEMGDSARQWDSYQSGDFDINGSNWTTVGTGDPTEFLASWYSKGGADYCGYVNEEFDSLYEELAETYEAAARKEIIQKLQQILIDDAAVIVHGYYNSSMISRNATIGGAQINTADYYWVTTAITPAE